METPKMKQLRELERLMALEFGWANFIGPYTALPTPTSIRVLEISQSSPIKCWFKIVDLNDVPKYSALSYTWGNPRTILPPGEDVEADRIHYSMATKFHIQCEGKAFEITANCYEFLVRFQQLRARVHDGSLRSDLPGLSSFDLQYLWIDAICINQDSLSERASQVRVMDRIYRQAMNVLIWLGCEDLLAQHGFNAISVLAKAYMAFEQLKEDQVRYAPMKSRHRVFGQPNDSPLLRSCGLPQIAPYQWQGLFALYKRAWFTRAWVIYSLLL
jgi:hypothetical protein